MNIKDVKWPICPIMMFFEGDEDKCDTSKCDFEDRRCSQACIIEPKSKHVCNCDSCIKLRTPKPLAQYLAEYLFHEDHTYTNRYGEKVLGFTSEGLLETLEQALDAYESTEHMKIIIERVKG